MLEELSAFMDKHEFNTIADFQGHSVQFFTTHADLVRRQAEEKAAEKAMKVVTADEQWSGDDFVEQSDALGSRIASSGKSKMRRAKTQVLWLLRTKIQLAKDHCWKREGARGATAHD